MKNRGPLFFKYPPYTTCIHEIFFAFFHIKAITWIVLGYISRKIRLIDNYCSSISRTSWKQAEEEQFITKDFYNTKILDRIDDKWQKFCLRIIHLMNKYRCMRVRRFFGGYFKYDNSFTAPKKPLKSSVILLKYILYKVENRKLFTDLVCKQYLLKLSKHIKRG